MKTIILTLVMLSSFVICGHGQTVTKPKFKGLSVGFGLSNEIRKVVRKPSFTVNVSAVFGISKRTNFVASALVPADRSVKKTRYSIRITYRLF